MAYIIPISRRLHTVVETLEFISGAKRVLADAERTELIDFLAGNPIAGDLMQGTNYARCSRTSLQSTEEKRNEMSKSGQSILRGARQALDYARGAREGFVAHVPEAVDVASIRKRLGLSQNEFA